MSTIPTLETSTQERFVMPESSDSEAIKAEDRTLATHDSSLTSNDIEYKTMGELEEGDQIVSSDGSTTTINAAYEHHIPESMYRLQFANGEIVEASGSHLWYTVNMLDKQMHKERIKRAKEGVLPNLDARKMSWLQRTAQVELDHSPAIDISFLFEALNVDTNDKSFIWSITRILESIGPVAVRNELVYDETIESIVDSGAKQQRLYSLTLFCQQMLALCAEALKQKNSVPYEIFKGRVRTTEEIANTWELKHDFPSVRIK